MISGIQVVRVQGKKSICIGNWGLIHSLFAMNDKDLGGSLWLKRVHVGRFNRKKFVSGERLSSFTATEKGAKCVVSISLMHEHARPFGRPWYESTIRTHWPRLSDAHFRDTRRLSRHDERGAPIYYSHLVYHPWSNTAEMTDVACRGVVISTICRNFARHG